jgi:surface carbohydrate biosynthesis protein
MEFIVFKKPRKLCVGLIVDHPTRDLAGAVIVAHHLAMRGFEACLIPMYQQGVDVPLLDLDALVVNFARPVNLDLVKQYSAMGIAVFVLDTEGGVLSSEGRASATAIAGYVKNSGFASVLSGYFFWGERLFKSFLEANVLDRDRLFLTGCPRFDFYAEELRAAGPAQRKGHLLINTNFPMANPRFLTGQVNDIDALLDLGFEKDYVATLLDENQRIIKSMVDLALQIAADLPEQQIIIRPHPFENIDYYIARFANIPNVLVDANGPVLDALKGAIALIHLNCGTAIEALMTGVPPITPDWLNSDFMHRHAELPTRASLCVTSYAELLEKARAGGQTLRTDLERLYSDVAEPFFFRNDGRAGQRVAEQLAAVVYQNPARRKINLCASLRGTHSRPTIAQRLQAVLANLLGSAMVRDLRSQLSVTRGGKAFRVNDAQKILNLLAKVEGSRAATAKVACHPLIRLPLATVRIGSED